MRVSRSIRLLVPAMIMAVSGMAQDKNFHIYLCLGQSNMQGSSFVEPMDRLDVSERFKVMSTVDYADGTRVKGEWYTAVPPLVNQNYGLTPMDYFGRTMAANLPDDIKIGVIPVAVAGCRIEHYDKNFDQDSLKNAPDWFKNIMSGYDNHPYNALVKYGRKAQKEGVIKGILLHQGESNTGDTEWPAKVNEIYRNLLADLGLNADEVPLLAGEVVTTEQGGVCGAMNAIIDSLPNTIPTAHVVSAANIPQRGDNSHFSSHGYRVLGCRYATTMLALMGIDNPRVDYPENEPCIPRPDHSEGDFTFSLDRFNPVMCEIGEFDCNTREFKTKSNSFGGWYYEKPVDISGYKYIVAELEEAPSADVKFQIYDSTDHWFKHFTTGFNGKKLVVIALAGATKNSDSEPEALDTSAIHMLGFKTDAPTTITLKRIYVTDTPPASVE